LGDIIGAGRAETEEWDSAPLELVSRPLSLDDEETSFAEIENILAMLKPGRDDDDADSNTGYYKTFTDAWCGLHVHIGLPPENNNDKCDEFLSLGMLQHLAYILILYEPALSTLHPRSRRPDAQVDLGSNRDMFYPEPDYGEVDWDAVSLPRDDRDSGYASDSDRDDGDGVVIDFPTEGKYDAVSQQAEEDLEFELQVQRRARELVFKPDQTVGGLCGLMSSGGQKGRLVNWTYLAGRGEGVGKRTLEFRQHEGSLEAGEVRRWVLFLRALVRWAEGVAKAAEGRREGDEGMEAWLEEVCGRGVLGIQELVERMELGEEGREWVRARVEMWKD
ncbi:MAG: hypothetical protein LQ338_008351, partial [Usnochroma carphineum]